MTIRPELAVPRADGALLSRRGLLGLGALLALPSGCAVPLLTIRQVNLDAIQPNQVLLLGRVKVTVLGFDRTGDTFIGTNAPESQEMLLPPGGEVAWVVQRRRAVDIEFMHVAVDPRASDVSIRGPILAPHWIPVPISYFGTIRVEFSSWGRSNRSNDRVGLVKWSTVDEFGPAMRSFVEQNPNLAERPYYNVLMRVMLEAPPAPSPRPG